MCVVVTSCHVFGYGMRQVSIVLFSLSLGGLPEPEVVQQLADSTGQEDDFDDLGEQVIACSVQINFWKENFWPQTAKFWGGVESFSQAC